MAKQVKDKWLGGRVDEPTRNKVNDYIVASDELTLGEFLRRASIEYMENHPIKADTQKPTQLTKPGE